MTEINELRNLYIDMYSCLRNYTWSFDAICILADIETEVYQAFPDTERLASLLNKFKLMILPVYKDDENIKQTIDNFIDTLNNITDTYVKLDRVQEVISKNENI